MFEWAQDQSAVWQFIIIFVIAFAPWMDVSIVAPLGVAWDSLRLVSRLKHSAETSCWFYY